MTKVAKLKAATRIRRIHRKVWNLACQWDAIPLTAPIVTFSDENPWISVLDTLHRKFCELIK